MDIKEKIKTVVLSEQEIGNNFAFIIDISNGNQLWIGVNFLFYEFKPELKCDYLIQKYKKWAGGSELIEEFTFKNVDEVIPYLMEQEVDPDFCRSMH